MSLDVAPHHSAIAGFVLVHRTLIDAGQQVAAVLRRSSDGREMPGLARVWTAYRAGLTEHHEGETEVVFPLVAERDPDFASLDDHLAREELLVLPRVVAVVSGDEMLTIERGFVRRIGPRRLAMTIASLDRTARREQLPMPPLPFPARLALPIWRWRHRHVLAGAGIDVVGGAS